MARMTMMFCPAKDSCQGEFKNRRKRRSRRGNEADRRRAEAALFRLRLWPRRDRVVAKRRRRRVAKAEVFFAPKSASSRQRLPFLNTPWTRAKTTSDFGIDSPSLRPSPIGWERENHPPSVGQSNRFGGCERRFWLFPLPSDGRGSG